VIVIEELSKQFPGRPAPAIEYIDLELRDGEIMGLVGLNGAGKTTTIRIAAGVSLPTAGRVLIDGHDIVDDKVRASEAVGWVPELYPFAPEARARRLLVYYAGFHGLTGRQADGRAREALNRVGLEGFEDVQIRTYSQGMKRRFGLAAAMLADPQNLLLDEILNGLDPEGMAFARGWVLELRKLGKGILLSSHLLSELEAIADRVAFIHEGNLIRVVDRAELARTGKTTLHITIEKVDSNVITYLGTLGSVKVAQDSILVSQPTEPQATITAELVRRGYRVAEIWSENASLEEYFLQLIRADSAREGEEA
jgi:ABC-2 type transport system ATP-binding protein